jgi:hypothetical protein
MTAEGYDEAVENGLPLSAAAEPVEPVALTETELDIDEIVLQEPGRDLRPDTITPAPDMGATEIPDLENVQNIAAEALASDEEIASAESFEEATNRLPQLWMKLHQAGAGMTRSSDASIDAAHV